MVREYKVFLIGSGYECVKFYKVYAATPMKAMDIVEELAETDGLVFGRDYQELEVDKSYQKGERNHEWTDNF